MLLREEQSRKTTLGKELSLPANADIPFTMSYGVWPPQSRKYLQEQLLPAFPFENSQISKRLFRKLFPAIQYFNSTLLPLNLLMPFMFS